MEESELLRRARAGDRDAFGELVEAHQRQVYHHALRMVGNEEDAADAAQEAFFKAWRGLPRFRGNSAFSTWLYKLADNAALDLLRREKKRRGDVALDDLPAGEQTAAGPSPQRALEERERSRAVAEGLAKLSADHRRALVLREIDGLSYAEIAEALEADLGTVKSRIARARMALAKILREDGNFSDLPPSKGTDGR